MSNIFSFPQQLYRFNLGAKKTVGTCLLHVKYLQFSRVAVQIQLAGKKNGWNLFVACQIFSVFHSSGSDSIWGQKKLLEPVCCMSNIFSFPQQLYRFNLGAKKRLEPLLHVKYFLFSIVAVQIQLAGKNCWNLFVACQIFSVFHSSSTDSTYRQKNCWNLFVACQIFSVFHSSCKDSTCRQKNCWNLFVACQIFSIFQSSCTDSTSPVCCMSNTVFHSNCDSTWGQKKQHVKYFQFSIVAVQHLHAKKLLEPVCCMSNIFSFAKLDGHSLGCWPCFQFYKLEGETFVEKQWFDPLFPEPFYCTPCPPGV